MFLQSTVFHSSIDGLAYEVVTKWGLDLRKTIRPITESYPKTLNPCNFMTLLLIHTPKGYDLTTVNGTEVSDNRRDVTNLLRYSDTPLISSSLFIFNKKIFTLRLNLF